MHKYQHALWWQMNRDFRNHCIDAAAWLADEADPFVNTYGDVLGDAVFSWWNGGEL